MFSGTSICEVLIRISFMTPAALTADLVSVPQSLQATEEVVS
jgi:hypothetical protein